MSFLESFQFISISLFIETQIFELFFNLSAVLFNKNHTKKKLKVLSYTTEISFC